MGARDRTIALLAGAAALAVAAVVALAPTQVADARSTQATVDTTLWVTTTEPPLGRGTVTVEPATGLVDGQEVAVSVVGFEPGEELGLIQCAPSPPGVGSVYACLPYRFQPADGAGELHTTFVVARTYHDDETGADIDCLAVQCFLGSGIPSGVFPDIRADLSFAPLPAPAAVPLPSQPDFTA